ncbi:MAG TPA: hypothetical protein VIU63_02455, partial [Nitrospira sp.]
MLVHEPPLRLQVDGRADRPPGPKQRCNRRVLLSVVLLPILFIGCSGPEYVPDITLTQARPVIDATAEFHGLYPAPGLLSGKDKFGLDAPKAERISPSKLSEQVGNELFREFDASGVFLHIKRFDPDPDVILTGRINSMFEFYRPQFWTFIPWWGIETATRMLNLKSHVSSGEVDLTLFVLKPTGEIIGTYSGKSTFKETFHPTDEVPPGARL